MKKYATVIFLLLSLCVKAQKSIPSAPNTTDAQGHRQGKWVITFSKDWSPSKNDIAFYRVLEYKNGKPVGKVRDYFAHNHQVQFEGEMIDDTPTKEKMKGTCIWYYENGQKQQEARFDNNGNLLERKVFDEKGRQIPAEQLKAQEDLEKGYQLNQEGKYQEALQYLESAKKVLNKENFGNYYHFLLGSLVVSTQNLKMWGKASQYADEYLAVLKEKFGENDKNYVEAVMDIAFIYEMANEFQKAEQCYLFMLRYVEKTQGKQSKAYVAQLNNLASTYFLKNDFKTALKYLQENKDISAKVNGNKSTDHALILENIGQCYRYMKDCKNAKPYLQEAMEIFREQKGTSSKEFQRCQKAMNDCQ
ncbi:tetratricopeptide repeat protein [Raineya orbicola]|uniref:Tetratricopeptide repeat n=1 Tax=Raineya orbicola TaxID=2016530 RepID=A0A2N3IJS7_9BACT|nr:tetratricopeptide repeat protein [Raineya orbicola]PKQ70566.1 Tetratricopeptide repeat [Raineya orbicola]